MKTYTLLSLGKIESIKNKKLCMLEDLKNGIWRHKKGRSKLYVMSNEYARMAMYQKSWPKKDQK
jgi:hypothetical protein